MPNIIRAKLDEAIKWLFATTANPWDVPVVPMSPKLEADAVAVPQQPTPTSIIDFPQPRPCSVEGCERPHHARGLCSRHYAQSRRVRAA